MGEPVVTKRTSGLVRSGDLRRAGPGNINRMQGWIIYKAMYRTTVTMNMFWHGQEYITETATVTLEAASEGAAAYWNGDFYWGSGEPEGAVGEAFWGAKNADREVYRRAYFDIEGWGEFFQWDITTNGPEQYEIQSVGFGLRESDTVGHTR